MTTNLKVGDTGVLVTVSQTYPGRVVCTDVLGKYSVLLLYKGADGDERTYLVWSDGTTAEGVGSTFVRRYSQWTNIYPRSPLAVRYGVDLFATRPGAVHRGKHLKPPPLGQLETIFEDGVIVDVKYHKAEDAINEAG